MRLWSGWLVTSPCPERLCTDFCSLYCSWFEAGEMNVRVRVRSFGVDGGVGVCNCFVLFKGGAAKVSFEGRPGTGRCVTVYPISFVFAFWVLEFLFFFFSKPLSTHLYCNHGSVTHPSACACAFDLPPHFHPHSPLDHLDSPPLTLRRK